MSQNINLIATIVDVVCTDTQLIIVYNYLNEEGNIGKKTATYYNTQASWNFFISVFGNSIDFNEETGEYNFYSLSGKNYLLTLKSSKNRYNQDSYSIIGVTEINKLTRLLNTFKGVID